MSQIALKMSNNCGYFALLMVNKSFFEDFQGIYVVFCGKSGVFWNF